MSNGAKARRAEMILDIGRAPRHRENFNPSTRIKYELPKSGHVRLEIFNIAGQKVATLVDAVQKEGVHELDCNGTGWSSGVYFYRLRAGGVVLTQKGLLLK